MKRFTNQRSIGICLLSMIPVMLFIGAVYAGNSDKIKSKIESALAAEGYNDITVMMEGNNKVRLEGTVDLMYDRLRIFDIAAKFPQVKNVTDVVIVNAPELPNDIIKSNIIDMFNLIGGIPDPNDIKIEVDDGVVQLLGTVDASKTKILAETAASWAKGVKGLVNEIKVLPVAEAGTDKNIARMIGDIINNWYELEKKNVKYNVEQGTVTLTGQVSSFWAKQHLAKDIACLVGVKKVENQLKVFEPTLE